MIEIQDLQKIVGQHTAIDIDQLVVMPGEIAAVCGPAGSGMELLLDLLTGQQPP